MRVALDVRALDHPSLAERGIGRYVRSLLEAFDAGDYDVAALRDLHRPPAPERIAEVFEHPLLGRDARRAGAALLHSPSIDFVTAHPRMPYVVTVHDLVPLKRPERYLRSGLKHRLRYAAVKRADRVIVPTHAVASDCERLLGVKRERIAVVAEAPAPAFGPVADPRAALSRFKLPERFLLWVGGLDPPDPRKGVESLVAAAARRSGPPLVLAGRISAEAAGLDAVLVGRVSDTELAALYSAADALVLPSDDEGFGLTAMEALACGTPVAGFAIPALVEQYDSTDGVTLVPPGDFEALLDSAERVAGTLAPAPTRTWPAAAAETFAVYEAAARDFR